MLHALTALECRRQYAGAFRPKPWIYWLDLALSVSIGWGAFSFSLFTSPFSLLYGTATLIAIVALLRAAIFIHELSHLKRGEVPGFEIVWNLVIGLPFLLPSLMYVGAHGDHHRQALFGTAGDPEYAPLAQWGPLRLGGFLVSTVFVPLLLIFRWGIIGPLSFSFPSFRRYVIAHASSLVINPAYCRPLPGKRERTRWYVLEAITPVVFWVASVSWWKGMLPTSWLVQWYLVGAGILFMNQVRTLAAHRYENDGHQLTAVEQLLDSINLTGRPIPTVLAAPVGLRYHALHHFLPAVPYHSLGALHRRLSAELPPDSAYHRTNRSGIFSTVYNLFLGRGRSETLSAAAIRPLTRREPQPLSDHLL